jgi:murein DD-endopeptidase MepM/ murein hydrolase activator NlpD
LIANPSLASANSLLSEGQILNVGAINPMFNVVEESEIKELVETNFDTITETDDTKYENQTTVKQEGKKGLNKVTEKVQYKNGVITNLVVTNQQQISKSVPKIVVKGTKKAYSYGGWSYSGSYIPALSNSNFGWPTVSPYIVTSEFKWRWGKHHDGIDISGCGMGSPIFAIAPGKVTQTVSNCPANGTYGSSCGGGYGNVVYIDHGNGMIVKYAHLASVKVSVGQTVSQGQVVGSMGNSGSSTGTHLHFEVRINGTAINPRSLY